MRVTTLQELKKNQIDSTSELCSVHLDITKMSTIMLQGFQVCENITKSYIDIRYELSIYEISRVSQYWTDVNGLDVAA